MLTHFSHQCRTKTHFLRVKSLEMCQKGNVFQKGILTFQQGACCSMVKTELWVFGEELLWFTVHAELWWGVKRGDPTIGSNLVWNWTDIWPPCSVKSFWCRAWVWEWSWVGLCTLFVSWSPTLPTDATWMLPPAPWWCPRGSLGSSRSYLLCWCLCFCCWPQMGIRASRDTWCSGCSVCTTSKGKMCARWEIIEILASICIKFIQKGHDGFI